MDHMSDAEKIEQMSKELQQERLKRKDAEKALLDIEQRYERLVNTVPCAIYDYIRYPDGQSKIIYISSQCKNIFEYDADQIISNINLLWSMASPDDVERLQTEISEAYQTRKLFQTEVRINLPSGGIKWVQLTSTPSAQKVDSQGIWSGVILDITELKKMEKKMLEVKKLESTAILAGDIAHDFNNLLGIIMGYIDLTLYDFDINHKNTNNLHRALTAIMKAKDLTQRFITFSSGGAPVKCKSSIKTIITESFNEVFSDGEFPAEFSFEENLWPLETDVGQIHQVFRNVLLNARESMKNRKTIRICVENISSLIDEPIVDKPLTDSKFIKIVISDQGDGIPQQIIHNIFDPYFSTKERGAQTGMGLGLTVALSIVKQHDGHLVVNSEENVGTSVCIYLPVTP